MRILVTGANGFIGRNACAYWARAGHEILAIIRNPETAPPELKSNSKIRFVSHDLEKAPGTIIDKMGSFRPDVLCHAAWQGCSSSQRGSIDIQTRQVSSFIALLKASEILGVRQFVNFGSQAECAVTDSRLSENTPIVPQSAYGAAKASCLLLGQQWSLASGIPYAHLRLLTVFGPGDTSARLVPYICKAGLRRQSPAISRGQQRWDFLYIDDLLDLLDRVVSKRFSGQLVCAAGEVHEIAGVARTLADHFGVGVDLGAIPYRENEFMYLCGDPSRAKHLLDWQPRTPIDDGLRRTATWWQDTVLPTN